MKHESIADQVLKDLTEWRLVGVHDGKRIVSNLAAAVLNRQRQIRQNPLQNGLAAGRDERRAARAHPGVGHGRQPTNPAGLIGRFGNCGVGIIEGPGLWQFDFGVLKTAAIRENLQVRLFAFATNLFNHPSLADPNMDISVPSTVSRIFGARVDF